jgi:hypothetical protein
MAANPRNAAFVEQAAVLGALRKESNNDLQHTLAKYESRIANTRPIFNATRNTDRLMHRYIFQTLRNRATNRAALEVRRQRLVEQKAREAANPLVLSSLPPRKAPEGRRGRRRRTLRR